MTTPTGAPSRRTATRPAKDDVPEGEPAALQAALSAEHAAVYGYGVVGGRVGDDGRGAARSAYEAHKARRNALRRRVLDLGGTPEPSAAAYALPFDVPDAQAAVRLAAELEDRVAAVYADLVRASSGDRREDAAAALREAALRAVRWRGTGVAFPGLPERSGRGRTGGPARPTEESRPL